MIIGLLIIIAVPKVLNTLNNSKKRTFELTAKSIVKSAEEKYIENNLYGLSEEITYESVSNITNSDFSTCEIEFDNEGNAYVILSGKGRYKGLYICNGTKVEAVVQTKQCDLIDDENNSASSDNNESSDTLAPVITIDQELGTSSDNPLLVGKGTYIVSETVSAKNGLTTFTVNDNDVTVEENGTWSITLTLMPDFVSEVRVVASDENGNVTTNTKFLKYIDAEYAYYNGIKLPSHRYSDYPYLVIARNETTNEINMLYTKNPVLFWGTDRNFYFSGRTTFLRNTLAAGANTLDGVQVDGPSNYGTNNCIYKDFTLIFSNYDIYGGVYDSEKYSYVKTDTVVLTASEPIPVLE